MALKQYLAHSVHFSGGGGHAHCKLCGSHWSVNTFRLCHQGSRQRLTQFQETGALGRTVSQRDGLMCNRTGQLGWLITCWYLISNLQDKILTWQQSYIIIFLNKKTTNTSFSMQKWHRKCSMQRWHRCSWMLLRGGINILIQFCHDNSLEYVQC